MDRTPTTVRGALPALLPLLAVMIALGSLGVAALLPLSAHGWTTASLGALALGSGRLALSLANPRRTGRLDVPVAFATGAVLGWFGWAVLVFGAFAGIVIGVACRIGLVLTGRAGHRASVASTPFLVAGAVAGVALRIWVA
ncbi:prepilin peptidase [Streptomyces sp. NPDC088387]|uniref:prepilin peptidase n=1 Tax=Streptomyces sp. NPDC088387 TaxID=3365859 RepID=UPI0038199017